MVLSGQYFLYPLCYLNLSHFYFVIPLYNELNSDFRDDFGVENPCLAQN